MNHDVNHAMKSQSGRLRKVSLKEIRRSFSIPAYSEPPLPTNRPCSSGSELSSRDTAAKFPPTCRLAPAVLPRWPYQLAEADPLGASLIRMKFGANWPEGFAMGDSAGQLNSMFAALGMAFLGGEGIACLDHCLVWTEKV